MELVDKILEKARERKGLDHREASVLLACEIPEKIEEMYIKTIEEAEKIRNKENVIILIKIDEQNSFCVFIDKILNPNQNANVFIFPIKIDEKGHKEIERKYSIRKDKINRPISVFKGENKELFIIGENDIVIMKQQEKDQCFCDKNLYDFGNNENEYYLGLNGDKTYILDTESIFTDPGTYVYYGEKTCTMNNNNNYEKNHHYSYCSGSISCS